MRFIDTIVVHCAATRPSQDITAEDVDRWHKKRGWSGIGYHYFIQRDGTLEQGRPIEKAGSHVKGHNLSSVGICYAGGIDEEGNAEDNRTPKQIKTMGVLIDTLMDEFRIEVLCGHRDFKGVKKSCPCFDVKSWYLGWKAGQTATNNFKDE